MIVSGGSMTTYSPAARAGTSVPGANVLSVANVSVTDERGVARLRDVSMEVRSGEIVGVAGIEGSGQRELLRVLAGRLTPDRGTVRRPSRIGFVPEDRLRDALIPSMTLVENLALKEGGAARGIVRWDSYAERARATVRDHDVRASGVDSEAGDLSGGNQQKFVLGRELEGSPEALIVENPTRAFDIRATTHVLAELRAARASRRSRCRRRYTSSRSRRSARAR